MTRNSPRTGGIPRHCVQSWNHARLYTLLSPLHLLNLVHGALEDVALVRLDAETGNVPDVGRQQLGQLLDVAALQLPSPLVHAAGKKESKAAAGYYLSIFKEIARLLKSRFFFLDNDRSASSNVNLKLIYIYIFLHLTFLKKVLNL